MYCKTPDGALFCSTAEICSGAWIYAKDATSDDLNQISELTGLELSHIRDSLDKYELPRVERIGDNTLFFIRHPEELEFGLYTATLTIITTDSYVIAISPHKSDIIEQILRNNMPLGSSQTGRHVLQILLRVTQDYNTNIKRVRHAILDHEQTMKLVDSRVIILLTKNEEILNQYLTALVPMRNLLEALSTERNVSFYEKDLDLLQDLMIALRQSEDVCRVNIKSIRSLRDSYQIIFTNDVNRTIKLLTALTVIFTIPAITSSIYGMNINLPFQANPHSFWLVMGLTAIASAVAIWLFRRNRWL